MDGTIAELQGKSFLKSAELHGDEFQTD